ncbi:MAG: ribonuclease P protein component [Planctomycetes bacterium]|nr:ribonuclease P protein component [Planctomycetota bacterium]
MAEAPQSERLPRRCRLKKRDEFRRVFGGGRRATCPGFQITALANDLGYARLGLAVGRGVGNSVVRNRVKRRVREVFRRTQGVRTLACDFVVTPRAEAARLDFDIFRSTLIEVFRRAAERAAEKEKARGDGDAGGETRTEAVRPVRQEGQPESGRGSSREMRDKSAQ